jgi:hypothetical protein
MTEDGIVRVSLTHDTLAGTAFSVRLNLKFA